MLLFIIGPILILMPINNGLFPSTETFLMHTVHHDGFELLEICLESLREGKSKASLSYRLHKIKKKRKKLISTTILLNEIFS